MTEGGPSGGGRPAAEPDRVTAATPAPTPLAFPDLRRLELDELLGQLVDRAHEVMGAQGRLRGLLRASQTVARDLALSVVLRRGPPGSRPGTRR